MRNLRHVIFYAILVLSGNLLFSQTGPAGVGTSTNNVLWLKADAGTSSTTNSTAISSWNDQSGNALNVTQTVSVQQPSFVAGVMNGFPAILFDNVNSSGQNDKMLGPDSPLLDNTSGYTFFTATRPVNLDGNARAIVSKRTTVSVDESFMLFYYTSNKLTVDIETTDDRFASNTTYSNNVSYIGSLGYNGAVATPSLRCTLYNEETFDKNAVESTTLVPDHTSPLLLGTTDASDSRPYGGYISEIIIYREMLAPVKRIIIDNYLSAKYNVALSANDKYFGDNAGNGDYDREVAGIGQESTGSSTSFSASVSGGLTIAASLGLDNTDYLMAGHAVATNTTITTDVGGMTGSNKARWLRIWYIDVTNILTDITANVEFDMSDGGMGAFTFGSVSNYVLLFRTGQTGNWTELATASATTGDRIQFNNVSFLLDGYYTLGTRDYNNSPLPITLLYFNATPSSHEVDLNWATASEKNTRSFLIERTRNGFDFETVAQIPAAGESAVRRTYSVTDQTPYPGISYYRLTELTTDGNTNHYPLTVVSFDAGTELRVFPDPADNSLNITCGLAENTLVKLSLSDLSGRLCLEKKQLTHAANEMLFLDTGSMDKGVYVLKVILPDKTLECKIILK